MRFLPLLLLALAALPAHAQLEISIDGANVAAQPIAVVPFAGTSVMTTTVPGTPGTPGIPAVPGRFGIGGKPAVPGIPATPPVVTTQTINSSFKTDIAAVVQADLERTGLYTGLPRSSMLETPSTLEGVDYRNWRAVARDYLVIGSAQKDANGLVATQFRLLDVVRQQELAAYAMPAVPEARLREVGHQIADLIFEKLTGTPGAFSTQIAYIASSGYGFSRRYELLVADSDGYNPRTAVTSREPLLSPVWSPDGKTLAYVGFDQVRSAIWLYTPDTGERRKLVSEKGINGAPAFSPDGRKLLMTLSFETNADIYEMDLASGTRKRLTTSPAIDTEGSYSPDGSRIAFTSDRGGNAQVYVMNTDGSNPKRVTFSGKQNLRPRFSPDGRKLAVVNADKGRYTIALVNLDANNSLTQLTSGPQEESPSFAPNGASIIFASASKAGAELGTVSIDGRVHQRLRQPGEVREPAWGPFLNTANVPSAAALPAAQPVVSPLPADLLPQPAN